MGSEQATTKNATLKQWSHLVTLVLIATIVITISSCFEEIPAGITSEINGVALDMVTKEPLAGARVAIFAPCPSFDVLCYYILDTTRTNNLGEFQISFLTDGKAVRYEIGVLGDRNSAESQTNPINVGKVNTVTLYGRKRGVLMLRVEIQNNAIGPIQISSYFNQATIFMNTRDTVIYGRIPHDQASWVTYQVYDSTISTGNTYRSIRDVIGDGEDTTFVHKKIIDPKLWPN